MKIVTKTVVNGNNVVQYVWEIDTTLPRVFVVGHEYKFNSNLVEVIVSESKGKKA